MKPFFFRITAADYLAAIAQVPEGERGGWAFQLGIDLVAADSENCHSDFAKKVIEEAQEFSGKKRAAANKRWSSTEQTNGSKAHAVYSGADAVHNTAMPETEALTEAVQKQTTKRFIAPTIEQVREYCQDRKNSIDPEHFIDHYEANGWMRGKNKIKDWKAAVRTWEKNDGSFTGSKQQVNGEKRKTNNLNIQTGKDIDFSAGF